MQNKNSEFCAPLTSFDWNETDLNRLGTSSIDTTCTIWDIEVGGSFPVQHVRPIIHLALACPMRSASQAVYLSGWKHWWTASSCASFQYQFSLRAAVIVPLIWAEHRWCASAERRSGHAVDCAWQGGLWHSLGRRRCLCLCVGWWLCASIWPSVRSLCSVWRLSKHHACEGRCLIVLGEAGMFDQQ